MDNQKEQEAGIFWEQHRDMAIVCERWRLRPYTKPLDEAISAAASSQTDINALRSDLRHDEDRRVASRDDHQGGSSDGTHVLRINDHAIGPSDAHHNQHHSSDAAIQSSCIQNETGCAAAAHLVFICLSNYC